MVSWAMDRASSSIVKGYDAVGNLRNILQQTESTGLSGKVLDPQINDKFSSMDWLSLQLINIEIMRITKMLLASKDEVALLYQARVFLFFCGFLFIGYLVIFTMMFGNQFVRVIRRIIRGKDAPDEEELYDLLETLDAPLNKVPVLPYDGPYHQARLPYYNQSLYLENPQSSQLSIEANCYAQAVNNSGPHHTELN